ncbi:MAG: hypothetical protein HXS48_15720 [Theionarchaea archaeon]|nr:hypothetical protein [Theionarchaea archaeon]
MFVSRELDAKSFIKSEGTYLGEFKLVLKLLIYCYHQIIENEIFGPYKSGYQLEHRLRNVLKCYLTRNKEKYGVEFLGFEIEPGEINMTYETIGFLDIKVTNACSQELRKYDEDIYYAIECKRLDNSSKKVDAYVKNGILRFIIGKYSKNMPLACMIGFIEEGNPCIIVNKINDRLEIDKRIITLQKLVNCDIQEKFEQSYISKHKRQNNLGIIDLYHLLFDYTGIIQKRIK